MSTKYRVGSEVPTEVLCKRLEELSKAVVGGSKTINREFGMRVPAEVDYDADLVLSIAAKRIRMHESQIEALKKLLIDKDKENFDDCGRCYGEYDGEKSMLEDIEKAIKEF